LEITKLIDENKILATNLSTTAITRISQIDQLEENHRKSIENHNDWMKKYYEL